MSSMKKPLQATLTTPPVVEYVAIGRGGWVVGGTVGRMVGGVPGLMVAVMGGDVGVTVTPG